MALDVELPRASGAATIAHRRRRIPRNLHAYLYMAPAVLLLLALTVYPLLRTFSLSVQDVNLLRENRGFVGLSNFREHVIESNLFWPSLRNSVVWVVGSVAGEYMLGLVSAVLLNLPLRGRGLYRMLMLIPWTVPIVVAAMTWKWLLDPSYGILNILMVDAGILDQPKFWLGQVDTALTTSVIINIWRSFPFYTISLLAAMQSVPKELHEAAALDGASAWRRFWDITMPHLKGVSIALIVLHVIWTFNNVDFIWLLTGGGPLHASETLATLVYRTAFREFALSDAAALSVLMILVLIATGLLYIGVNRRFGEKESQA